MKDFFKKEVHGKGLINCDNLDAQIQKAFYRAVLVSPTRRDGRRYQPTRPAPRDTRARWHSVSTHTPRLSRRARAMALGINPHAPLA